MRVRLLGGFTRAASARDQRRWGKGRLLTLTTEQYSALDLLADNRQCLFRGAAGTGKTMLALEYAKRMASAGNRTLLLCFNRLLGDWLHVESARCTSAALLTATTYHRFVREMILKTELADEFRQAEAAGDKRRLCGICTARASLLSL